MDTATLLTIGLTGLQAGTGVYQAVRRTKVEALCEKILDSGLDVSLIKTDESMQGYFFSIIDRFVKEANKEKIDHWKNAMIHLLTDFNGFDYNDNFLSVLEALTAFDLTILTQIYLINKKTNDEFLVELLTSLISKGISEDMVVHSVKRLASHNLISELYVEKAGFTFGGGPDRLQPLRYTVNDLGRTFLKFVSDYEQRDSGK